MSHPNKQRQRENKRIGKLEERLSYRDICGKTDITPKLAVDNIRARQRAVS